MPETRSNAALLCCKVFLRYLDALMSQSDYAKHDLVVDIGIEDGSRQSNDRDGDNDEASLTGVQLWERILEMLERLSKSGAMPGDTSMSVYGGGLDEAVPESVKNIVLVMANGGYLAPYGSDESTSDAKRLWEVSVKKLERFLPGLLAEVFPPSQPVIHEDQTAPLSGHDDAASATADEVREQDVEAPPVSGAIAEVPEVE